MPDYLLEGGMVNLWYADQNGPHPAVAAAARQRSAKSRLFMSAISLGEIEYGHACYPAGAGATRQAFVAFLRQLPLAIAVTHHTAAVYGQLRARIIEAHPPQKGWRANKKKRIEQLWDPVTAREIGIDENDLWIASQAMERNLVLVTDDKMKKIKEIAGTDLVCENWKTGSV